ncbi:Glutamate 5-kinase [Pirellulimonas nuda]|uniref:Glutamate 5-kinase n=1 Tax=Pirellulimonas nuda TaxID=2528009 RepID=A0A518D9X5_9BACT|nr:glutamate 5-kinase [Pirellulimonas nuda]QDU88295.1 Glutamate 5-kinase [Pirellulimonas nuda]
MPAAPHRSEIVAGAHTVVAKVGTRVLTAPDGSLDVARIESLAGQLAALADAGRRVALVSSGAVGAGVGRLKLPGRPSGLAQLQAVAAVGQSRLIEAYNGALQSRGRHAAQVLLTADDLNDRARYLNVRNTLTALFEYGAIPVINENDTVRVDELQRTVGDNDRLAAVVANLLRAPLLVLLSDVEGLYDRAPDDPDARLLPTVDNVETVRSLAVASPAGVMSRGGMASKLEAARLVTAAGENAIIANGRRENVLVDLLAGKPIGTLFVAQGGSVSSRKRWLGSTAQPSGRLTLDAGACRAVTERGSSLLAVGISAVDGGFDKGDLVALCDGAGSEVARGLANYSADEIRRIAGHGKDEIAQILGHCPYDSVVHRDHLALVR